MLVLASLKIPAPNVLDLVIAMPDGKPPTGGHLRFRRRQNYHWSQLRGDRHR